MKQEPINSLNDLFKDYKGDYVPSEWDTGAPVGKEILSERSGIGASYSADEVTKIFQAAVENEIADKQRNALPFARYDQKTKEAFLEFPDGSRKYD